jgi:two-component system, NarL family, response regulator LiaR
MTAATVLLVEDDGLMRLSLAATLQRRLPNPFVVVGQATNGQEALDWLAANPLPHVVVMDVGMPMMDGVEATRRLKLRWPTVPVVMLTSHEEPATLLGAFGAGAQAYCLKDTAPDLLCTIVEQAIAGACWVDPKLAPILLGALAVQPSPSMGSAVKADGTGGVGGGSGQGRVSTTSHEPVAMLGLLTEREMDVLRLLAVGMTNQAMAQTLVVSLNTVKTHMKNIFSKLGVEDRTEAALLAVKQGLNE